jgi:cytoskeletal protein CcmA (bactofilin family)
LIDDIKRRYGVYYQHFPDRDRVANASSVHDCGRFKHAEAVMFRSAASSTENVNEPKLETASIAGYSTYQPGENLTSSSAASAITPRLIPETAKIAREIREGTLSGFVGSGTAVTGQIAFKSLLRVDGLLSGRVTSTEGTLIVGAAGRVEAKIAVAVARIHGSVTGDIVCTERAELGPAARVTGNIHAPTLVLDRGAVFDGKCMMTTPAAEPEVLIEQATAIVAAAPQPVAAKPRSARKGNALGTKPRRTRSRAATAKGDARTQREHGVAAAG